jgi:hypothetical protein
MQTLHLGNYKNVVGLGSHDKERAHTGGMGISKKQNMIVFDAPTAEELIQKLYSNRSQYEKRIRNLKKRTVRDESNWNVTHLYIKAMLGFSLYSYSYLN